jgi:hypothetical protein
MRNKKPGPTPPPSPGWRAMLLITRGKSKNERNYATMSMITRELYATLCLAVFYFHQDALWKSLQLALNSGPTHDVYDQEGFSLKIRKTALLFSTTYSRENGGVFAAFGIEPTISMTCKDLIPNRRFPGISYLAENRSRSSLALKRLGCRTHDFYETKWLTLRRRLSASYRPQVWLASM